MRKFKYFTVYNKTEAGNPELHKGGPWFYEPNDWQTNEVYSKGFRSYRAALKDAMSHVYEMRLYS